MNHIGKLGGRMGVALDYARLSQLHRPTDPGAFAAEIRRLNAEGLKPRDIASHLGMQIDVVLTALREVSA